MEPGLGGSREQLLRKRSISERWFSPLHPGSLRAGVLVLTTTAIGAGVLMLPYASKVLGWALATGVLMLPYASKVLGWALATGVIAVLAILNVVSLELLLDAGIRYGVTSYSDLVYAAAGPLAARILDFSVTVVTLGGCTAYFIFVKQLLPTLLHEVCGLPAELSRAEVVLPVVAALVFTISLPRDITALGRFVLLGMISVVYVCMLTIGQVSFRGVGLSELPAAKLPGATPLPELANACAIIMSAFLCQYNVFFVRGDVKCPTTRRMRKITRLSTTVQTSVYVCLALCGYACFGQETHDNVYTNFPKGQFSANFGRFLQCIALCVQIPLCLFGARANLIRMLSSFLLTIQAPTAGAPDESRPRNFSEEAAALGESYTGSTVETDDAVVDLAFARQISPAAGGSPGSRSPSCSPGSVHSPPRGKGELDVHLMASEEDRANLLEETLVARAEVGASSWLLHVSATACVTLVTVLLAFLVPSVGWLQGKCGGLSGTLQMYAFPGVILLKCPDLRTPFQRILILSGFFIAWLIGFTALVV